MENNENKKNSKLARRIVLIELAIVLFFTDCMLYKTKKQIDKLENKLNGLETNLDEQEQNLVEQEQNLVEMENNLKEISEKMTENSEKSNETNIQLEDLVKAFEKIDKSNVDENIYANIPFELYKTADLYIHNVPNGTDGMNFEILAKNDIESKSDTLKETYYARAIDPDYEFKVNEKDIIDCSGETWLPDYRYETITPFDDVLLIKNFNLNKDVLNTYQIYSLEKLLNYNNLKIKYADDHKYYIEKLFAAEIDGKYSLYTIRRSLSYSHNDKYVHYFYDLTDYYSALRVISKKYIIENTKEILPEDCTITSLNVEYMNSLENKIPNIIYGEELYKLLTEEQINNRYLNQMEIRELIQKLNDNKYLKLSK